MDSNPEMAMMAEAVTNFVMGTVNAASEETSFGMVQCSELTGI